VKISHISKDNAIAKHVEHAAAFILVNERKDFATFYTSPQSRYEGFFVAREGSFIKTVSRIGTRTIADKLDLYHNKGFAALHYSRSSESGKNGKSSESTEVYSVASGEPVLIYENLSEESMVVRLDIRDQFYIPEWGRYYDFQEDKKSVIVSYHDDRLVEPVFLAILHDGAFHPMGEWVPVEYERDRQRNSEPAVLYEYDLGEFSGKKLVFAFGETAAEALGRAHRYKNLSQAKVIVKSKVKPKLTGKKPDAAAKKLASECAHDALDSLFVKDSMLAGMPWFTKAWVRDELISLPAMPKAKARAMLAKYIHAEWEGDKLPVIFGGSNYCSDGIGLLCWAILFGRYLLDEEEKRLLGTNLVRSIEALEATENEYGFVPSGKRESWMDSIERDGYPIETQALYGQILQLAHLLTKNERYEEKRAALLKNIRTHYFVGGYLHDCLGDGTIRPNIFLAAFFAPEILSKAEWEKCFDKALPALWLEWGGLASVDARHECFCDVSTGEQDTSYHNGDSWFFVNNIAALILYNVNPTKYAKYTDAIYAASTWEILWDNFAGCPGEISSARTLESWGCGLQGFSAAAYVYLTQHLPVRKWALKGLFAPAAILLKK